MSINKKLHVLYHKYLRLSKEEKKEYWLLDVTGGILIGAGLVASNGFMVLWGVIVVYVGYRFLNESHK